MRPFLSSAVSLSVDSDSRLGFEPIDLSVDVDLSQLEEFWRRFL